MMARRRRGYRKHCRMCAEPFRTLLHQLTLCEKCRAKVRASVPVPLPIAGGPSGRIDIPPFDTLPPMRGTKRWIELHREEQA